MARPDAQSRRDRRRLTTEALQAKAGEQRARRWTKLTWRETARLEIEALRSETAMLAKAVAVLHEQNEAMGIELDTLSAVLALDVKIPGERITERREMTRAFKVYQTAAGAIGEGCRVFESVVAPHVVEAAIAGEPQGRCDFTQTERFANPACECPTYEGNLGPCRTFEAGLNGRCVYCDHAETCHAAVALAADAVADEPVAAEA